MTDPIVKIALPGKTIDSTDIRDYAFISSNTCNKLDSIKDGSITINVGGTSGSVTVSHSLGYICEFDVYEDNGAGYELWPKDIDAYVTNSGITITKKIPTPLGEQIYNSSDVFNNNGETEEGNITQWFYAGCSNSGFRTKSAIRWENLIIPQGQTLTSANLQIKNVFTDSGTDLKFYIYGIDEDNTGSFSGDPTGRTKTSAYRDKTQAAITSNFNFEDDITTLLQEVVNRTGWSSGNAFGIIIEDYDSDNGHQLRQYVANRISENLELAVTFGTSSTFNYKIVIYKDKIA